MSRVKRSVTARKKRRKVLEQAIKEGSKSAIPVARVLAGCETPIDIHWLD